MVPNSCVPEMTTLFRGVSTDVFSYFASRNLHHDGILSIFHAPMSFFDTTVSDSRNSSRRYSKLLFQPMGRIIGVFGKDIDSEFFSFNSSCSLLEHMYLRYRQSTSR